MKAARFASPAGFGLVLLLFLLMPFLSVSCDVPDSGEYGAAYTGLDLATGATPELEGDEGLRATVAELVPGGDTTLPPAGVQGLAIVAVLLLLAGLLTPLLPRLRAAAAVVLAVAVGVVAVVAQSQAQENVRAAVLERIPPADRSPDFDRAADTLIQSDTGFWLVLSCLGMLAVLNAGMAFVERRERVS